MWLNFEERIKYFNNLIAVCQIDIYSYELFKITKWGAESC